MTNGKTEQDMISTSAIPVIPGLDTAKGIAMTGGKEAFYRKVLLMFCDDAESRLQMLTAVPDTDTLPSLISQAHSLKGVTASIGADEASAMALELETAGKSGNLQFLKEKIPAFTAMMRELIKNIQNWLNSDNLQSSTQGNLSESFLNDLNELKTALQTQKIIDLDRILDKLGKQPLDAKNAALLSKISDQVLVADYDDALETLLKMLESVHKSS